MVRERPFRNHHAGGMSRGVPGQSFKRTGDAHQLFHPRIGLDEIAQFRFLIERLLERDVELIRDELGHAIDFGIGNFQHTAHIPDRGFRPERPERNDLGDVVLAILVDHVVDDLAPAFHAEVHVDIGEGHALGIQEPFEQERVDEGVEVRDAQRIGDETSGGGASARSDRNVARAGKLDDVPYDEEIAGEPHRADDRQLFTQAKLIGGRQDLAGPFFSLAANPSSARRSR